jgi:hypothetical protein
MTEENRQVRETAWRVAHSLEHCVMICALYQINHQSGVWGWEQVRLVR